MYTLLVFKETRSPCSLVVLADWLGLSFCNDVFE